MEGGGSGGTSSLSRRTRGAGVGGNHRLSWGPLVRCLLEEPSVLFPIFLYQRHIFLFQRNMDLLDIDLTQPDGCQTWTRGGSPCCVPVMMRPSLVVLCCQIGSCCRVLYLYRLAAPCTCPGTEHVPKSWVSLPHRSASPGEYGVQSAEFFK